jgi:molybdenum cofactor biosynthesis enzyme MoaA
MTIRTFVQTLLQPISPESRRVSTGRFEGLPDSLKTPEQIIGFGHHSCGATHGVLERCDFACTSCYLGEEANAAEPLPREDVFQQLDQLREFLGPQGKAQITAGEVTLLPRETLGEYVRYAIDIGLDPMVMTHGRRFLLEPEYLRALIEEDGLEKISIHVDSTQRGREEWSPFVTEEQLNPVRDRYANLIRHMRARTGRKLHAAHTVTVTHKNLDQIADVVGWLVRNLDAFRMVSFQPVAEVGRTEDQAISDLKLTDVWDRICAALGKPLNRDAMHFGHPECHIMVPVVVARAGERHCVLETVRAGKRWDRSYLQRLLRAIGGYSVRGKSRVENLLGIVSLTLRSPLLLVETLLYGLYRTWGDRRDLVWILLAAARSRQLSIRPLALVVHKFMSPWELETPLGRERLAACTFRLPVEGEMIPMCELNATGMRSKLYPAARSRKAVGQ